MADKSKKQQTMLNAHLHELLVVELKDIPDAERPLLRGVNGT